MIPDFLSDGTEKVPTSEEVADIICQASQQGLLGLFVGSGFSKAVVEDKALSWDELLEKTYDMLQATCSKAKIELEITKEELFQSGNTYPVIASKINQIANRAKKRFETDTDENLRESINPDDLSFRDIVANLVSVYPSDEEKGQWKQYFDEMDLRWVITTNYDHIIECLLGGRALSLYPDQVFTSPKEIIPVFHLHGSIWNPASIVITNEDYARMLRPGDYRQARLPSLLKESTVLMAGYELGDLNVLSAVDWCETVEAEPVAGYSQRIIFIRYINPDSGIKPREKPYTDPDTKVLVIETTSLDSFFCKIANKKAEVRAEYSKEKKEADSLRTIFSETDWSRKRILDADVNNLIKIGGQVQKLSGKFPDLVSAFLGYLKTAIKKIDEQSHEDLAFEQYDYKLKVLLMIMDVVEKMQLPDEYIAYLCVSLNQVAAYFGNQPGDAYRATSTWQEKKSSIPKNVLQRMKKYCNNNTNMLITAKRYLNEINR